MSSCCVVTIPEGAQCCEGLKSGAEREITLKVRLSCDCGDSQCCPPNSDKPADPAK